MDVLARLQVALASAYRVERELGAGGMATVYLGRDLRHGREVAIKVLHEEISASLSVERFLQEIQIAAQLQHPLIIPLFDSGEADGLYYYVMPRVEGETLRQRLEREKRIPLEEAVQIGREVADALEYAHGHGVVHRDIKPENIMLSGGHPLVADFGIARALRDSGVTRMTTAGVSMGTPHYMSPEQALGDPGLDHRSDLYSLGCVICEMVTGTPPFTGTSMQSVISGHLAGTVDLRTRGSAMGADLRRTLETSLAKDPADRFQSAAEFGRALTDPSGARRRRGRIVSWRNAVGVVVGVAIGVAGWTAWSRFARSTSLDPDLVAVAPFDALGAGLDVWREGAMDMLSRNLNGAGPLRVVSSSVIVRNWSGRADAASAQAIGRETGAGLSVVGSLVAAGPDSVRLSAIVVDVAAGTVVGQVDFKGDAEHLDVAVDSLTLRLLGVIGRVRSIGAVNVATVRSTSLAALKEFMQGEQSVRRADWDSATVHFERATALDTTFALAYYRIFQARASKGTGIDSLAWSYALRAGALNRGLAPRESLMIAADSMLASVSDAAALDAAAQRRRERVIATLELAVRRFPDDAEVWYNLGRARNRIGYLVGATLQQALEALDKAIALDSAFAPAYVEAISSSTPASGEAATQRYLMGYLALRPKGVWSEVAPLALALMDPQRAHSDTVNRLLDAASARVLYHTMAIFEFSADSADTHNRLGRLLVQRPFDPSLSEDASLPRRSLGYGLAYRGHMAEALSILGHDRVHYLSGQIAALGAMQPDSARAVFGALLDARPAPHRDLVFALPWWATVRDTTALHRAITMGDRAAAGSPTAQFLSGAARAWLALARGDSTTALTRFVELPALANDEGIGDWELYTTIRLLNDARRYDEAFARLEQLIPSTPFPWDVVMLLERARASEGLGRTERAAAAYARVAALWARGDEALQPTVAAARAAAARLGGPARP